MNHFLFAVRAARCTLFLHFGALALYAGVLGCLKAVVDSGTSLLAVPTAIFPELYERLRHKDFCSKSDWRNFFP